MFIYEGKSAFLSYRNPYVREPVEDTKFLRLKSLFFEFETTLEEAFLTGMAQNKQLLAQLGFHTEISFLLESRRRFEETAKSYFTSKCPNLQIEMHHRCQNHEDVGKGKDHFVIWGNTTFRSETSKDCGF